MPAYCEVHHQDLATCNGDYDAAEHALGQAIHIDRQSHAFPGFGILPDCAVEMLATLREQGFDIVKVS